MTHRVLRFLFFIILLTVLVFGTACSPVKPKNNQVLLLVVAEDPLITNMDLMLNDEVGVMVDMLEKAGYKGITATISGKDIVGNTETLTPDMKLAEVKLDDFAGVIVPCMARDFTRRAPTEAIELVTQAVEKNMVVAAQVGGVATLYDAGVLKGKKIAMFSDAKDMFPDSIVQGDGVVQDGNIITSGMCPFMASMTGGKDGTAELTQKFIDTLKSK